MKMEDDKKNQVAAKLYIPHEDPMLSGKSIWFEAEHWGILYSKLDQELITRKLDFAQIEIYTRWKKEQIEWTFKYQKTYVNLLSYPEYMFLKMSDKYITNLSDIANRLCIHIPSGTVFHIFLHPPLDCFGKGSR